MPHECELGDFLVNCTPPEPPAVYKIALTSSVRAQIKNGAYSFLAQTPLVCRFDAGSLDFDRARRVVEQAWSVLQKEKCTWVAAWNLVGGWMVALKALPPATFLATLVQKGFSGVTMNADIEDEDDNDDQRRFAAQDTADEDSILIALCDLLSEAVDGEFADERTAAVLYSVAALLKDSVSRRNAFRRLGGCRALAKLLASKCTSDLVATSAAFVARYASHNHSGCAEELLANDGICTRLLHLALIPESSVHACLTISNLCYNNEQARVFFIEKDGVRVLDQVLRMAQGWPVIGAACRAVSSMSYESRNATAGWGGPAESLIWWLVHAPSSRVANTIAIALKTVLHNESAQRYARAAVDAARLSRFHESGALSALVDHFGARQSIAGAVALDDLLRSSPLSVPSKIKEDVLRPWSLRNVTMNSETAAVVWMRMAFPAIHQVFPARRASSLESLHIQVYVLEPIRPFPKSLWLDDGRCVPVRMSLVQLQYSPLPQHASWKDEYLCKDMAYTADSIIEEHYCKMAAAHPNMTMMTGSAYRLVGATVRAEPCIAIFVTEKGVVPDGSNLFPVHLSNSNGDRLPVDVREGTFDYLNNPVEVRASVHEDIAVITVRDSTLFIGASVGNGPTNAERPFEVGPNNKETSLHRSSFTLGAFVKPNEGDIDEVGFITVAQGYSDSLKCNNKVTISPSARDELSIQVRTPEFRATVISNDVKEYNRDVISFQKSKIFDCAYVPLTADLAKCRFTTQFHPRLARTFRQKLVCAPPQVINAPDHDLFFHYGTNDEFSLGDCPEVFKVGRTTGLTRGFLHHEHAYIAVNDPNFCVFNERTKDDIDYLRQLKVTPNVYDQEFVQGGDAGSLVCAFQGDGNNDEPSKDKAVPIGIAIGALQSYYGIVTPLAPVLQKTNTRLLL